MKRIGAFISLVLIFSLFATALTVETATAKTTSVAQQTITQFSQVGTSKLSSPTTSAVNLNSLKGDSITKSSKKLTLPLKSTPTRAKLSVSTDISTSSASPAFSGFDGLTHRDQRLAGTGAYSNTQFSLEPPDQALCVSDNFVFEAVNTALAVYSPTGTLLSGPTAISQFLGLTPEFDRVTKIRGPEVSDPRCYYDSDSDRFFLEIWSNEVNPITGAQVPGSAIHLSVSQTGDPTGAWLQYTLPTTNSSQQDCPCFPDFTMIGADKTGFHFSVNQFGINGNFSGVDLYSSEKAAFVRGEAFVPVVNFYLPFDPTATDVIPFTMQPSTTPPGGGYDNRNGGTEYFVSAPFVFNTESSLVVWAITNTSSLGSSSPSLTLSKTVVSTLAYTSSLPAVQKDGPRPYGESLGLPAPRLDTGDYRTTQVSYVKGQLVTALATDVAPGAFARTGAAFFILTPSWSGGVLGASVSRQGVLSFFNNSLTYPSIGVRADGKAVMTMTLVGPDYFPSAVFGYFNGGFVSGHLAAAGAGPADGFTGYGGAGVERWGDYSATSVSPNGKIWVSQEFIPNAPRTLFANWGTHITAVNP